MHLRKLFVLLIVLLAAGVMAQDNTYTSDDGTSFIRYPAGWAAGEDAGDLLFANSEEALGRSGDILEPGDISGRIIILPFGDLVDSGLDANSTSAEVMDLFILLLSDDEGSTTSFATPQPFDADGKDGAISVGTVNPTGKIIDAYLAVVRADEAFALVLIVADGGNPIEIEQILQDVSASFDYDMGGEAGTGAATPPVSDGDGTVIDMELPNSVSATDPNAGDFAVSYPGDWVHEVVGSQIYIANGSTALDNFVNSDGVPLSGQVGATVLSLPKEVLPLVGSYADTPEGLLQFLNDSFSGDPTFNATFEETALLTLNGRSAAILYGTIDQAEGIYDVVMVAVDADALHGVVVVAAETGTAMEYEDLALAMAQSIQAGTEPLSVDAGSTTGGSKGERPSVTEEIDLSGSVSFDDTFAGFITISHPADWVTDTSQGQINFGNTPSALANFMDGDTPIAAGDIAGSVLALPYGQMEALGEVDNAEGVMAFVVQVVLESDTASTDVSEPETTFINDVEVVSVVGEATDGLLIFDIIVTVTDTGNGYVVVLFGLDEGTAEDFLETALAIAGTATIE